MCNRCNIRKTLEWMRKIAEIEDKVRKINDEKYLVKSNSNEKYYSIQKMENKLGIFQ